MDISSSYANILVSREGRVGVITLNRPKALNALNWDTAREIVAAATELDRGNEIGCIVLTGSERAFAAGADIKEMSTKSVMDWHEEDFFSIWDKFTGLRTPIIAAVAGYALGGGCEVAMMCDLIIAADNAKFGQPEINLGVMPGMGGSQRLVRAVGKSKAMDMCLTGRFMDAAEAERSGLVARVVPAEKLLDEAMEVARTIASKSKASARLAKQAINATFESPLSQGLALERQMFYALFDSADQAEGMAAFIDKRDPEFKHR